MLHHAKPGFLMTDALIASVLSIFLLSAVIGTVAAMKVRLSEARVEGGVRDVAYKHTQNMSENTRIARIKKCS